MGKSAYSPLLHYTSVTSRDGSDSHPSETELRKPLNNKSLRWFKPREFDPGQRSLPVACRAILLPSGCYVHEEDGCRGPGTSRADQSHSKSVRPPGNRAIPIAHPVRARSLRESAFKLRRSAEGALETSPWFPNGDLAALVNKRVLMLHTSNLRYESSFASQRPAGNSIEPFYRTTLRNL
ncbi:hypothetical protein NDU88_000887 [Pleurodeles waltl]|uniref:Uncharacterized protein n=1 Tax=Pleurodeles waltl TaxID=8319 RepID=A0AAV7MK65_PLEWA|nr:hypothetical protein NDU88_000887 [Pleurodeles waltl]